LVVLLQIGAKELQNQLVMLLKVPMAEVEGPSMAVWMSGTSLAIVIVRNSKPPEFRKDA
jgi:hypothetical protein